MAKKLFHIFVASIFTSSFIACGGGGGGGGAEGATRETAVRIVHASIDQTPVTLRIAGQAVQTASYTQATTYVQVEEGAVTFVLERANEPAIVNYSVDATLADDTEYTLFITGRVLAGSDSAVLLTDVVGTPAEGFTNIRILNAYDGGGNLRATVAGETLSGIAPGTGSSFVAVPSGLQTFVVSDQNDNVIANISTTLTSRGEATLLVAGARSLGTVFTRIYNDLD
jgi:hypothetical protein